MTVDVTVEPEVVPDDETTIVVAPVIVNDTAPDPDDSDDTDLALIVGALATTVETLVERVNALAAATVVAEETAGVALEIAVDANENAEVIAEEVDVDLPPDPIPWTHRTGRELFGKS